MHECQRKWSCEGSLTFLDLPSISDLYCRDTARLYGNTNIAIALGAAVSTSVVRFFRELRGIPVLGMQILFGPGHPSKDDRHTMVHCPLRE